MKIHPTFGTKFTIRVKPSAVDWETLSRPLFYPFPSSIPLVSRAQLHRQVRHYTDGHHTVTWSTNKVSRGGAKSLRCPNPSPPSAEQSHH